MKKINVMGATVACVLAGAAFGAPRDIQFTEVNFASRTISLTNFGAAAQSLNGFRFCTSSPTQVRVYTTTGGLNGVTMNPGDTFVVHLNNDAPLGDPLRRNASAVGNFAPGFSSGAYGLSLYFPPVTFANPETMADHVQWNIAGANNASAATRAGVAVNAGLWTVANAFVATEATTASIRLLDSSGGLLLHGPADYEALGAPGCPGDTNGDGLVNFSDLNTVLSQFGQTGAGLTGDINDDGVVNFSDLNLVLSNFGTGCAD